ncbi:phenylacetate-CoA ligase [Burkholderiales bacterium]|nr:phenylacetate-CoA ligase [Burkholderiales bacterium]
MGQYFDRLETRDPELREREQFSQLRAQIAHAKAHSAAYGRILEDVDPRAIVSRSALARVPVTRKSELVEMQRRARPFGGLAATRWGVAARVFASPGPIFEPEGRIADYWRFARALFAAGFRQGDLVHNCFSYHFTPGGSMVEQGALALGCTVFPGGVGQTEQQIQVIAELAPDGYAGTPSFLEIILDRADAAGMSTRSLRKALVSGEAFSPASRDSLIARGIAGFQLYGTADLGAVAYETAARDGLIVDEGVLVEVLQPGTGDPVAPGEIGEVVVTTLHNADYPLIRFGTGDLSAFLPGTSPCGRTNARLRGWMGRADQATKVRGLFVHPSQISQIVRQHPEIRKARLVVDHDGGRDRMMLHVELAGGGSVDTEGISATMREVTKLRGGMVVLEAGELPDDGKVVDDRRRYDASNTDRER